MATLCCDTTRRARSALSCVSRGTGVSICETRRLLTFTGLFIFHLFVFISPARVCKKCASGFSFLVRDVDLKSLQGGIAFGYVEPNHLFSNFQERHLPQRDPVVDCPHHHAITGGKFGFADELSLR